MTKVEERAGEYLCEYPFNGQTWCFRIWAESHQEAQDRLRAMPWASVKGRLMAIVPVSPGAGLLVRLEYWLRNLVMRPK